MQSNLFHKNPPEICHVRSLVLSSFPTFPTRSRSTLLGTAHGSSDAQQLVPSKNSPEICHVGPLFGFLSGLAAPLEPARSCPTLLGTAHGRPSRRSFQTTPHSSMQNNLFHNNPPEICHVRSLFLSMSEFPNISPGLAGQARCVSATLTHHNSAGSGSDI